MSGKVSKLRDEAQKAVNKGKHKKTLNLYLELEALEPNDGGWTRRVADMYRRLGRGDESLVSLERAADKYARAGFAVKAIAVCKLILQHDSKHVATQQRLAELNSQLGLSIGSGHRGPPPATRRRPRPAPRPPDPPAGKPEPAAAPPVPAPPPEPAPLPATRARTLPPGAPLDTINLADVVPGSAPAVDESGDEGDVADIPLAFDLDELMADAEAAVDDSGSQPLELTLDEDDESAAEAAERLRNTPFFSALGPGLLESFVDKIELVELAAGEVLFRAGDPGDSLYVVAEGEVAVFAEGPPRIQLSRLKEGDFFGEIGLVTEQPRSATIEAVEPTELLVIGRDTIGDLVEDEPQLLRLLLRLLRDRLLDTLIRTNALFGQFGGTERQQLAEKFRFLEGKPGSVLIRQGARSAGLYILLAGQAEVMVDRDGDVQRLATLGPGDICGEMSLLAHDDAVATVRLTTKAFVLKLPAEVFRQVIMTHPQVLMFVGDLAEERKRQLTAIQDGDSDYEIVHLDLL